MHATKIMIRGSEREPRYQTRCIEPECGEVFGLWRVQMNAEADAIAHEHYEFRR